MPGRGVGQPEVADPALHAGRADRSAGRVARCGHVEGGGRRDAGVDEEEEDLLGVVEGESTVGVSVGNARANGGTTAELLGGVGASTDLTVRAQARNLAKLFKERKSADILEQFSDGPFKGFRGVDA